MIGKLVKKTLVFTALVIFVGKISPVWAADPCESLPLAQQPECYSKLIGEAQNQRRTLSSDINLLNNQIGQTRSQIRLTEDKIASLNNDIASISGKIVSIEGSLNRVSEVFLNRIAQTYKTGRQDTMFYLFTASNFDELVQRFEYLRLVQKRDKERLIQMAALKQNYNDQKNLTQEKKKQKEELSTYLKAEQARLDRKNREKQQLLADTQNSEEEYRRLRAQAEARLAAFSAFASLAGGGVLGDQTKCNDGWNGCYYSQRDSKWAYRYLPGSSYTFLQAGCLATSMAMVLSHYGYSVTPETMANTPEAFSFGDLRYSFSINGASINRNPISGYSQSTIDSEISAGRPVIIQLYSASVSGRHFIVLISGSNGSYKMNDPVRENGHNIDFTQYYTTNMIASTDVTSIH